jgi:alcohol dehydrogenase class IV
VALVDPELSASLPAGITASTGLDALTQLIEPYVSHRANPMTDALSLEGLRRVARSLRKAYEAGDARQAREDMALGSLISGICLANAALGAVHGFAAPLGGMYSGPHGAICAALLPAAMEVNVRALRQRQPEGDALRRYTDVARLVTNRPSAQPEDGALWVRDLCAALHTAPLSTYGVRQEGFPELIEKATKASSMKGNPIALTAEELREILERSL